jgi:hypothetical protein
LAGRNTEFMEAAEHRAHGGDGDALGLERRKPPGHCVGVDELGDRDQIL